MFAKIVVIAILARTVIISGNVVCLQIVRIPIDLLTDTFIFISFFWDFWKRMPKGAG